MAIDKQTAETNHKQQMDKLQEEHKVRLIQSNLRSRSSFVVKGREDSQRDRGEEIFSLCPLERLLKAVITCEQSLSATSSLQTCGGGGGGQIIGRQCPPTSNPKANNIGRKEPRECLPCGFNHVIGDIKRPLREILLISVFFNCFS